MARGAELFGKQQWVMQKMEVKEETIPMGIVFNNF